MRFTHWILGALSLLAMGSAAVAQDTAASIAHGAALFAARCSACHGADATGISGPDLTQLSARGLTDDRIMQTIRSGVPGSIMPPSMAPDSELRALVAYLRSLGTVTAATPVATATNAGEQIFWSRCGSCHRVGGRGGRLGPDLSRIGDTQAAAALTRSIREPSATIGAAFKPVTLVTNSGQRIRGTRKGEDAFSIQIMETNERLQGYLKSDLREVIRDTTSLMPAFGPDQLPDQNLDALVQFLGSLRRTPAASR